MKLSLEAGRVNARLSLEEAAKIVNIPLQTLQQLESDNEKLKEADTGIILKLCKAYGLKLEDISL